MALALAAVLLSLLDGEEEGSEWSEEKPFSVKIQNWKSLLEVEESMFLKNTDQKNMDLKNLGGGLSWNAMRAAQSISHQSSNHGRSSSSSATAQHPPARGAVRTWSHLCLGFSPNLQEARLRIRSPDTKVTFPHFVLWDVRAEQQMLMLVWGVATPAGVLCLLALSFTTTCRILGFGVCQMNSDRVAFSQIDIEEFLSN